MVVRELRSHPDDGAGVTPPAARSGRPFEPSAWSAARVPWKNGPGSSASSIPEVSHAGAADARQCVNAARTASAIAR